MPFPNHNSLLCFRTEVYRPTVTVYGPLCCFIFRRSRVQISAMRTSTNKCLVVPALKCKNSTSNLTKSASFCIPASMVHQITQQPTQYKMTTCTVAMQNQALCITHQKPARPKSKAHEPIQFISLTKHILCKIFRD